MFIARRPITSARFGGAELNVPNTSLVSFRPSEPRGVFCKVSIYRHFTPTECNPFVTTITC